MTIRLIMRRSFFFSFPFLFKFFFHLFMLILELDKISRHGFKQPLAVIKG